MSEECADPLPPIPEDEVLSNVADKRKRTEDTDCEIISSLHGRKRRKERGISKAAFVAAVKHGEKSPSFNPKTGRKQWIFDYKAGGITVITDESCKHEITSWAHSHWGVNLEKVPITKEMEDEHAQAVRDRCNHDLWDSHAVAVLDQSGSMRRNDTSKGVSRSDLVWVSLAVDYVGKRLRTGEATCRDYFSLIRLDADGEYLIKEHPVSWILYNRIIDLLRTVRPLGHGNYLPALDSARKMLLSNKKGTCLLQLVFLTDGAPSDEAYEGCGVAITTYHVQATSSKIASIARKFGSRLTFGAIAVGDSARYDALEAMIGTAKDYSCHAYLYKSSLEADDMSSAFSSMSTMISSTKLTVTDMANNRQRNFRDFYREPKSALEVYEYHDEDWLKFRNDHHQTLLSVRKTYFSRKTGKWEYPQKIFQNRGAVGLAIRNCVFGEGRERAVRRVREINASGEFVGPELVGKESLFVEEAGDSISFHKTFCLVQQLARKMALKFNQKLLALPGVDEALTPTITFLDCYVMRLNDEALLVEKMIDPKAYKKWNNNDGYVASTPEQAVKTLGRGEDGTFSVEDIPQAYSHFTYLASERRFLVCDLQGVLNNQVKPPAFELTDPAIHYTKMTSRKDFGRTDRGEHGIEDFLATHTCSNLCRMILDRWIEDPLDRDIIQYEDALCSREDNATCILARPDKKGSQPSANSALSNPDNKTSEPSRPKKTVRFGV